MTRRQGMLPRPRCLHWLALLLLLSPAAGALDTSRGLLWRLDRDGSTRGYLFGTIHTEDRRVISLPPAVATAFDRSNGLVLEAVLDATAILEITQRMLLPPNVELADRVGQQLAEQAVETARRHGLPGEMARRSKPWALAVTLSTPLPQSGLFLDMLLQQRALLEGKTLAGLERIADQFDPFEALTPEDERLLLEQTIARYDEFDDYFEELLRAYLDRNLARLEELADEQMGQTAAEQALMHALLVERNRRMAQRADELLRRPETTTFIAVGALHLPGDDGLVKLLSDAGYHLILEY